MAAAAIAAFRPMLQPAASGNGAPVPVPTVRFQRRLHRRRVGLRRSASRPVLLPPSAAAAVSGKAAPSSDGGEREGRRLDEGKEEEDGGAEEEVVEPPPPPRPREGQEPGRLFVGNLPYTMTSAELAEAFSEAGTVDDTQIIYDKVTNRSRGFAFVTMATAEEAANAVQMFDGALLGGRTARVNYPEVPRGRERDVVRTTSGGGGGRRRSLRDDDDGGAYKVYAGNLGWGVRADALRAAFEGRPGLVGARVILERDTGRSRGFGFVSFGTADDARAALQAMDGVELEGRPLRLSLAEQNPPA